MVPNRATHHVQVTYPDDYEFVGLFLCGVYEVCFMRFLVVACSIIIETIRNILFTEFLIFCFFWIVAFFCLFREKPLLFSQNVRDNERTSKINLGGSRYVLDYRTECVEQYRLIPLISTLNKFNIYLIVLLWILLYVYLLCVSYPFHVQSVIREIGESENGCFKKTKHAKFSEKRIFLTPWYAHVRSPFCLITDDRCVLLLILAQWPISAPPENFRKPKFSYVFKECRMEHWLKWVNEFEPDSQNFEVLWSVRTYPTR